MINITSYIIEKLHLNDKIKMDIMHAEYPEGSTCLLLYFPSDHAWGNVKCWPDAVKIVKHEDREITFKYLTNTRSQRPEHLKDSIKYIEAMKDAENKNIYKVENGGIIILVTPETSLNQLEKTKDDKECQASFKDIDEIKKHLK